MQKLISFSIIMLSFFISCKKDEAKAIITPAIVNDTVVVVPIDTTAPSKYFLALGDSYTIGQSVADSLRFPVQAVKILKQNRLYFYTPEIRATTGWTTGNLLSSLNTNATTRIKYDIVTLLIGVNNQYQGRTQAEYRTEFTTLLNKAIQYAGFNKNHVIVLSIPDYSVTPYASGSNTALIAAEIDAFNAINKDIATLAGVNYLDITGYTRLAATDPSLITYDGLHPSGKEYKVWADTLAPMIRAVLQ